MGKFVLDLGWPAIITFTGIFLTAVGGVWGVLEKKQSEVNRQTEIINMITGGDSYCFFDVTYPGKKSNVMDFHLVSAGKYRLFDVLVQIVDVEKLEEIKKEKENVGQIPFDSIAMFDDMYMKASRIIDIGNFGPNQEYPPIGIPIPTDVDKKSFNIEISARNGSVRQAVRLWRINHEWKMAKRTMCNGKLLEEVADPDFPRNKEGKVVW